MTLLLNGAMMLVSDFETGRLAYVRWPTRRIPHPLTPRRMLRFRRVWLRWQRRAIFVLGGMVVGATAYVIALSADAASSAFKAMLQAAPLVAFVLSPVGFALSAWASQRFFPNSGGSGIPQAIAARQLQGVKVRERLVSIRIAVGKMILLMVGFPMPIDIIKPCLELFDKPAKARGLNGDARAGGAGADHAPAAAALDA